MNCQKKKRVHGRTARSGHELPKVSPGPAMPFCSAPCKQAVRPIHGWPTPRAGSLRLSSTSLDTPRRALLMDCQKKEKVRYLILGFRKKNLTV
jgi:hypothetical protein